MVDETNDDETQIQRFKRVAMEMGLAGEGPESLDRIMGRLDLTRKPEKAVDTASGRCEDSEER